MNEKQLDELERLEAAATPGEWGAAREWNEGRILGLFKDGEWLTHGDYRLAAAARNSLKSLIDQAREAMRLRGVEIAWAKRSGELTSEIERLQAKLSCYRQAEDEFRGVLSSLSSWLGSGLGDDKTTAESYERRIRDGIETHINVQSRSLQTDKQRAIEAELENLRREVSRYRQAEEIQMRRDWGVSRDIDGWYPTAGGPCGVHCVKEIARSDKNSWPDPTTALIEADAQIGMNQTKRRTK